MIADTAWVQEGEWGDENTPDVQETVDISGQTLLIDYREGLYDGRRTI
jgi:hypothetical protein